MSVAMAGMHTIGAGPDQFFISGWKAGGCRYRLVSPFQIGERCETCDEIMIAGAGQWRTVAPQDGGCTSPSSRPQRRQPLPQQARPAPAAAIGQYRLRQFVE